MLVPPGMRSLSLITLALTLGCAGRARSLPFEPGGSLARELVALTGEHRAATPWPEGVLAEIPLDWRTLPTSAVLTSVEPLDEAILADGAMVGLVTGAVGAWSTEDGHLLWSRGQAHRFGLLEVCGVVVMLGRRRIEAFDPRSGEERWEHELDGLLDRDATARREGCVLTISMGETESSFDARTGERTAISASLAHATPDVLAAEGDALVRRTDGAVRWRLPVGPRLATCLSGPGAARDGDRLLAGCGSFVLADVDLAAGRLRGLWIGVGTPRRMEVRGEHAVVTTARSTLLLDLASEGRSHREVLSVEDDRRRAREVLLSDEAHEEADTPWHYPRTHREAAEWFVALDPDGEVTMDELRSLELVRAALLLESWTRARTPDARHPRVLLERTYDAPTAERAYARLAALRAVRGPLDEADGLALADATLRWVDAVVTRTVSPKKEIATYRSDRVDALDIPPVETLLPQATRLALDVLATCASRAPLDLIDAFVRERAGPHEGPSCEPDLSDRAREAVLRATVSFTHGRAASLHLPGARCVRVPTLGGWVRVDGAGGELMPECVATPMESAHLPFRDAPAWSLPGHCISVPGELSTLHVVQEVDGRMRRVRHTPARESTGAAAVE